jgi:hypothetical protein
MSPRGDRSAERHRLQGRHTPKTIVVSGGDVSQILINGADSGSTAGAFKLGVGETIAITYNTSAPSTVVFAE